MAEKKFEAEDPMELVGAICEGGDADAIEEMGRTFVEELARMGWPREDIIAVFADPFYRGPHTVFRSKGMLFVAALVESILGGQDATRQARRSEAPQG